MLYLLPVVNVPASGTAVPFVAAGRTAATWFSVQARNGNAGPVYIGDRTVKAGSLFLVRLVPGAAYQVPAMDVPAPYDLTLWFVDADNNGDGINVAYFKR